MNLLTLTVLPVIISSNVNGQSWNSIPKWADFGFYGGWGFEDLDFKLEFLLDNYQIISIEKCTGNGQGKTVSREKFLYIYFTVNIFPQNLFIVFS